MRIPALFFFTLVCVMALSAQTQDGSGTWYETESKGLFASHADWPFGTRIRVTNLQNNKQVIVTIDNRINQSPDRIVDISKAAAENIGMNPGTTPVRIEVISRRSPSTSAVVETSRPTSPPPLPPAPVVVETPRPATPPTPAVVETSRPATPPAPAVVETSRPATPPAPAVVETPPPATPKQPEPAAVTQPVQAAPVGVSPQTVVTINIWGERNVKIQSNPVSSGRSAVTVIPAGAPRPASTQILTYIPAVPRGPFYRLQVGSFLEVKNAVNTLNRLRTAGFSPYYERYGNYYRVVILGVRAADVQGMVSRLGTIGFQEVLVRGQY